MCVIVFHIFAAMGRKIEVTEAGTTVMIAIANASTFVMLLNIAILLVMRFMLASALANAAIAFCDGGHIAHRCSRHRDGAVMERPRPPQGRTPHHHAPG